MGCQTVDFDAVGSLDGVRGGADIAGAGGVTSVTLDGSNKTFALNLNGTLSNTIVLTEGTYDNDTLLDSLAAEMQSKINADSNLKNAGQTVTVQYD